MHSETFSLKYGSPKWVIGFTELAAGHEVRQLVLDLLELAPAVALPRREGLGELSGLVGIALERRGAARQGGSTLAEVGRVRGGGRAGATRRGGASLTGPLSPRGREGESTGLDRVAVRHAAGGAGQGGEATVGVDHAVRADYRCVVLGAGAGVRAAGAEAERRRLGRAGNRQGRYRERGG